MQNVLGPLINLYQTQLDISRKCADAVFSGTERIDRVVIGATQRMFSEQMNFVQSLASVRDPRAVGDALQSGFTQHGPDEAMNYQKEIMTIFADMQNEIGKSLQGYVQQFSSSSANASAKPLHSGLDQANDTVFNPMTSMFSVWETAFKDAAALARQNMAAARSANDEATTAGRHAASRYADVASGAVRSAAENAANAAAAGRSAVAAMAEESASANDKKGTPSPSGANKKK